MLFGREFRLPGDLLFGRLVEEAANTEYAIKLRQKLTDIHKFVRRQYKRDLRPLKHIRFESRAESLASRGFLRSYKPYSPSENVNDRLCVICESVLGSGVINDSVQLSSPETKFRLLHACFQDFQHAVPNSLLHKITTLGDVVKFYNTPANTITPFDSMKQASLPPNLHIQSDYHRFHPETDTMFGGISAFPKSSTIVTGLKYKKKYKGYVVKPSWPYEAATE
ncbi:hypothetical protein PR048_015310 [Dryococelus australis]|uniref:Large ribosomal subunit protein mL50 n=1 Tax=Dryococelus australis TaxID=614101 RepID=A0ABQ9HGL3_9NEOP|nr:hypothetical protein PR048_015310 [Dryococelus australis]